MGEVKEISAQVAGWGVAGCAALLAFAMALGGVESQVGTLFSIPGLKVSARARIAIIIMALIVAAAAVPISNAVVNALW